MDRRGQLFRAPQPCVARVRLPARPARTLRARALAGAALSVAPRFRSVSAFRHREESEAAAPPRDVVAQVMKDGVKALMALPAGTVVCFVDSAGPLAAVRDGGSLKAPRWVLRPYVDLNAARGTGARPGRVEPSCTRGALNHAAFSARKRSFC
jgi:hypothetical protein